MGKARLRTCRGCEKKATCKALCRDMVRWLGERCRSMHSVKAMLVGTLLEDSMEEQFVDRKLWEAYHLTGADTAELEATCSECENFENRPNSGWCKWFEIEVAGEWPAEGCGGRPM